MTEATVAHRRYDGATIALHWTTAALVLILFGTSLAWNYGPRGWDREALQSIHISLGIALAAVLIVRLAWRLLAGRRLAAAGNSITALLSRLVHFALYLLLIVQAGLGFGLRWVQGETFSFFGLFSVPALIAPNRGLERVLETWHNITAWTLIYLVAGHAAAALIHHYAAKDGILRRMLPMRG
jgi:cytochrome b561